MCGRQSQQPSNNPLPQDDVLFANLTVRETFEFAVNIRLPASVSKETKAQVRPGSSGSRRGGAQAGRGGEGREGRCVARRMLCVCKPLCPSSPLPDFTAKPWPPCFFLAQLVDDVIAELALSKAANTFIGNAFIR